MGTGGPKGWLPPHPQPSRVGEIDEKESVVIIRGQDVDISFRVSDRKWGESKSNIPRYGQNFDLPRDSSAMLKMISSASLISSTVLRSPFSSSPSKMTELNIPERRCMAVAPCL